MNNKLTAKVTARNYVNSLANELLPEILEAVKALVGQKVGLKTGGMSAKLSAALEPFRSATVSKQIYFITHSYSIDVVFKTCEAIGGEDSCVYSEQKVSFAHITNGILEGLYAVNTYRTDFTVEEIENARKEICDTRDAMRAAERKLIGFGEHDNG